MSEPDPGEAMRQTAREVLRELLPGMLDEVLGRPAATPHGTGNGNGAGGVSGNGNGAGGMVPRVPAPPVAAVLRPSTWAGPAVPGELIGERGPAGDDAAATAAPATRGGAGGEASGARVERVTIASDEDLERFVRALVARMENPRDRRALRSGRLRFVLQRSSGSHRDGSPSEPSGPMMRMEKGAVTERLVREAAAAGAGIMLARGAVLTPLARDLSRALRVRIEREG
jgi:hypothetical protein